MKTESVLCWTARIWGIASASLLLMFAFGGREHIRFTSSEAVGFLFFPIGIIIGFAVAWRNQIIGGIVTVGSLVLFFVWLSVRDGRFQFGPYFLLFAAPGFLHIVSGLLARQRKRDAVAKS